MGPRPRPTAVALLPTEPGVYRFRDDLGRPLYIGRAGDLRRRVGSYWGNLRDRPRLRRMIPQVAAIEALVCASEPEAAWAERMLLEHRKPRWNRAVGGMENPLYVRVDTTTPAIGTGHEVVPTAGVRWYGPYLGGTATRLAVAALERLYPLSYSRARLTGTERDLARIHGVVTADAGALVDTVDAVLHRDPGAVRAARAALVARRDAAATDELFEVASRIHEELRGFEWVVAPVRLFCADADLAASADGMQVTLRFRSGTLCSWEQAPATSEAVTAPAEWDDFLRRNATLAAALHAHPPATEHPEHD